MNGIKRQKVPKNAILCRKVPESDQSMFPMLYLCKQEQKSMNYDTTFCFKIRN